MRKPPCFSRNRCTTVEQIDGETLRSTCRLQDTLTDARVEIRVKLPELEIMDARCEFQRTFLPACRDLNEAVQQVVGVRVGPGMNKIIRGKLGDAADCGHLTFLVEEACHGVILSFTRETLQQVPDDFELTAEHFTQMVRDNIRLYNRCAAFAPGSSIVEGIEPPEQG
jgi:hypothetical protein